MPEFINRNLEKTEPDYFYTVTQLVTTFGKDDAKNEPFIYTERFQGNNLLKCKTQAEKYYYEKLSGLENNGKYFLPFAAPKDFVLGENAAFSITLSLIEYYTDDNNLEYPLLGEDDETIQENRIIERGVLIEKGFLQMEDQ